MDRKVTLTSRDTPDKNLGGRPRREDSPTEARRMQRFLMHYRSTLVAPSAVTGQYLTTRGQAYWIYLRDQRYPPDARHKLIRPNESEAHMARLHERATAEVRRAVLARHDKHFAALRRGEIVCGVRLHPDRDPRAAGKPRATNAYQVSGLPGLFYRDISTPLGETAGEPSKRDIRARRDAVVEIKHVTRADLESRRELYLSGAVDEIAIAERVAELLILDQKAERQLRRLLKRARAVEFVHLGSASREGKPRAKGALEALAHRQQRAA